MDHTHTPDRGVDRRGFVRAGALAAATAGGVFLTGERVAAQPAPGGNALPNLYPNWNAMEFQLIRKHENAHLPAVINAIRALGGTPRPKPNFKNLEQPNVVAFGTVSQTFENTGTGANYGAAPAIFSKSVLAFLGSIGFIEARHAGYLNSLFNDSQTANVFGEDQDFETALTPDEVMELASPFIVNLNGGPEATYSKTPSRANDIAILNFALVIEYLENDFYNINVPKFFPQQQQQQQP